MRWMTFSSYLIVFVAITFAKGHEEDDLAQWFLRLKSLLKGCPSPLHRKSNAKNDFLYKIRYCMQSRALSALDNLLSNDVILISDGIQLVRYKFRNSSTQSERSSDPKMSKDDEKKSLGEMIINRIVKVFRTHILQIDIDVLTRSLYPTNSNLVAEGRRRKRRYHMMPLMATGLLIMGSVLVPMGFQFLAVLGGKALLLAKMALLLSSIQGLKKVATNSMNYGFYHAPIPDQWHERSHSEPAIYNPPPPYATYHHHP